MFASNFFSKNAYSSMKVMLQLEIEQKDSVKFFLTSETFPCLKLYDIIMFLLLVCMISFFVYEGQPSLL